MSGLVENSLVKKRGVAESFSLVWLNKKLTVDGVKMCRCRAQDGHVFDMPESEFSPIFPTVEATPFDKEAMKAAVGTLTDIATRKNELEKENLALPDQLNKATVENAKLKAKCEKSDSLPTSDFNFVGSWQHKESPKYIWDFTEGGKCFCRHIKTGEISEACPVDADAMKAKIRRGLLERLSPPPEEEKKLDIDWSKDVYFRSKDMHPSGAIWRVSPDGVVDIKPAHEGAFPWERSLNTKKELLVSIGDGSIVVIPNPWPEPTQKPSVEEAGGALAEEAETTLVLKYRPSLLRDIIAVYKAAKGK